ncbi:AraC-type DNA-binding protein [Methylobacterium phyllostachyos]|uniref:AraC-type DNA-binding protein n=1 Tax=Methylobacterium phyllostachyos TaxID=582672 RepID=A0A1G9W219_9HYPH|nr:AraC family transcriptional regulator [Methylobacterium phyllostachyos]SDM78257.1 AraC-type DNA-binding protein [Methylobacterium phyllostachyos]
MARVSSFVCVSSLCALVREFTRTGLSPDQLLARHGLQVHDLDDPYRRIPVSDYVGILEYAARFAADPMLGAKIGMGTRPSDLGPVGMLFAASGTLRAGLNRLARTLAVWQDATHIDLREDEAGRLSWSYRLVDAGIGPHRQDDESAIFATAAIAKATFGTGGRPVEVHFAHPARGDAAFYARYFGMRPLFGQSANRLFFAADAADRVVRIEDGNLTAMLERHIRDLAKARTEADDLIMRVRNAVCAALPTHRTTLEDVAAKLGMTPRTLQRRLAERNTSLRELVIGVRLEASRALLSEGNLAIADVARNLGYSDGTAFWRAFKARTGMTPLAYRNRL